MELQRYRWVYGKREREREIEKEGGLEREERRDIQRERGR